MNRWDRRFIQLAQHIASWSKDETEVGCIVVGPDREIRATGYNGIPPGVVDDDPARMQRPKKYLFAAHAEQNAISFAAMIGVPLKGCTVYVTHHPCSRCAQMLIRAGVGRVVIGAGQTHMPADEFRAAKAMLFEVGVSVDAEE